MCHKCAANIGKTELTYMPTIVTEDEESDLKEEEEMKYRPRHILCLNIRNASPSPVCKKQCTSSVGEKKSKTPRQKIVDVNNFIDDKYVVKV